MQDPAQVAAQNFCAKLSSENNLKDLPAATGESVQHLKSFLAAHGRLAASASGSHDTDELLETRTVLDKRNRALESLTEELEGAVQAMRDLLDNCHSLLESKATAVAPDMIIRYSHRLSNIFTPLGTTPGLLQEPPAPQPAFMLASNLNQFNYMQQQAEQQAREQEHQEAQRQIKIQQQKEAMLMAMLPPDWRPGDPIPDNVLQHMLQDAPAVAVDAAAPTGVAAGAGLDQTGQPLAPPALAAAAADMSRQSSLNQAGMFSFALNKDLEEDLEGLGSEVEEEYSEEDYSDD